MLKLRDVRVYYGHLQALQGVSLEVGKGEIVALIGANGAGKSTTLSAISGLVRTVGGGEITYQGKPISGLPAHAIVKRGIIQVPEGRAILTTLKVRENLELGAFSRGNAEKKRDLAVIQECFPVLREKAEQPAGILSGGEQQMLALGRALMSGPQLLLLDEPSMGLAPLLVKELFNIIQDINSRGTAILLVEQNARMALKISKRGYVIENGRIVLEDDSAELLHSKRVIDAYLGG